MSLLQFVVVTSIIAYAIYKLRFGLTHFKINQMVSAASMLDDMPSVSVCIPARNETHAMTQCLEHVIASTYPKLEIIVLDDSSVDNTSFLIKAFAHDGVRFVEGSPLPDGWLGKNHALQGLLNEASGTYILYMDVDTIIAPDTIEQLVAYVLQEEAAMVSVLPRRNDGLRMSVLFSPLRYFWELMMHTSTTPAVASSAWMIDRSMLRDTLGGFSAHATDIQPEASLAGALMAQHSYRFLIGTPMLSVAYEKKWRSQVDTSIRLLFPLSGGRLGGAIVLFLLLVVTISPLVLLISASIAGWSMTQILTIVELIGLMATYSLYTHAVWRRGWWIGGLLMPIILIQEIIILVLSVYHYLRRTVTWKGRPVMNTFRKTRVTSPSS